MFADALLPPTYCFDWYMLGWPASLIVPLALSAALITAFVWVARRVRTRWRILLIALCVVLFVVVDLIAYGIGVNFQSLWRTPRYPPMNDVQPTKQSEQDPT